MNVRLTIVGSGPQQNVLKEYVKKNKLAERVEFIGWTNNDKLAVFYKEADVFVGAPIVTSNGQREAFANVYGEAMACGTPVMVTDIAGNAEIIENGVNGFVVRSRSVGDIVKVIAHFYDNTEASKAMGSHAVKTIKPYSKIANRDKYIKVFKGFLQSDQ